ncbi:hypothetical protein [Klebsiella variicola]|uniref:hypothetical protein n=1 Tax=Klebsiella variicola TaxID=244366 RepID=UPI0039771F1F
MDSEPVAEITEDLGRLFVKIHQSTTLRAGDKLYRHAQPAPVVQKVMSRLAYLLDEDQFHNIESMVLAVGIHPAGTSQVIPEVMSMEDLQYKPLTKSWREGWNACRAAMLQAQSDDDGGQTDDERIMAIEGIIKPTSDCDAPVYPDAEKRIADAVELLKKAAPGMLAGKSGPDGPLAGRMKPPVIPDGYVMAPKEPTEAMIAAAMNCEDVLFNSDDSFCVKFGNIYEAMLAAAPQEVTNGK